MNFAESAYLGLDSLRNNRLRSWLTILGILIGIAAIVSLISAGRGSEIQIKKRIETLGTNIITVYSRRPPPRKPGERRGISKGLILDDLTYLKRLEGVKNISPEISVANFISAGKEESEANVYGVSSAYPEIRNLDVEKGKFFTSSNAAHWLKVAVLGSNVADELFPEDEAIGKKIKIKNHYFTVCGVLAPKGQMWRYDFDQQVYVPDSTAYRRLTGDEKVHRIIIQTGDEKKAKSLVPLIEKGLLQRHQNVEDFRVRSQEEMLEAISDVSRTFTILLSAIAGISLLVGGIGIMNIMLVSVTERYREIGIRKAVGARKKDILAQFLVESVVLSLVGGFCGIIFGILIAKIISVLGKWTFVIPLIAIILPFLFSTIIGLFFGLYPARKASSLDPIEALRYQ